ncbi:hypothetical protein KI387_027626, partial [Taxus chinensis]
VWNHLILVFEVNHGTDCSTIGNKLEPTSQWLEVLFCTVMVLSDLLLFTQLIGNIQLKMRDLEWWMRSRIPSNLRDRARNYESQYWVSERVDEMEMIHVLPHGLRREIERRLCFDLLHR